MANENTVESVGADLSKLQLQYDADSKSHSTLASLTDAQKESMAQVLKSLQTEEKLEAKQLPDQATLWRFMEANSFNTANAIAQYKKYLQWRSDNNVDNIANREIPQKQLIRSVIPYAMHGFAKNGSPLYIEKTGRVHTWAVGQIDLHQFELNHIEQIEIMVAKLKESSTKTGHPVCQVTSIIDLEGLGLGHRHAVGLLQSATQLDGQYYPSIIGDIYVLNCPWVVPGLWEVVKSFLPSSTMAKIHILGADYKDKLRTVIDADQLPEEYGGTCKCAGGCVKQIPEAEVKQLLLKDHTGLQLTEKYIAAGSKFEISLDGDKGDEFNWSFDVVDGYDLAFGAELKSRDNPAAAPVFVKLPGRCVTSKGQYTATGPCTLVFQWDNSYSYFNGKNLKYHASVAPASK